MIHVSRGVLTGRWPWLMVLRHHAGDLPGSLKAALLLTRADRQLIVARAMPRDDRRAIATPLVFVVSFLGLRAIFGNRLDGHHYTTIVPFLYAAFGAACAAGGHVRGNRIGAHRAATGFALLAVVAVMNTSISRISTRPRSQRRRGDVFGRDRPLLARVGGRRSRCDRVFPGLGLRDAVRIRLARKARLARQRRSGSPRARELQRASRKSSCSPAPTTPRSSTSSPRSRISRRRAITTWAQRDGVPVFQSARYAPRSDCTDVPGMARRPRQRSAPDPRSPSRRQPRPIVISSRHLARPRAGMPATPRWLRRSLDRRARGQVQTVDRRRGAFRVSTTQWATPGMAFVLIDPVTQKALARTEIARIACPVH